MDMSIVIPINASTQAPAARDTQVVSVSDVALHVSTVHSRTVSSELAPDDASSEAGCELARLRARVRELAGELVHAQEAARRHLARELHDGVGAELTATRFALASVDTWLPADAPAAPSPNCTVRSWTPASSVRCRNGSANSPRAPACARASSARRMCA